MIALFVCVRMRMFFFVHRTMSTDRGLARRTPTGSRSQPSAAVPVASGTLKYHSATSEISFCHPIHKTIVRHDERVFRDNSAVHNDCAVVVSFRDETLLFNLEALRIVLPHVAWQ